MQPGLESELRPIGTTAARCTATLLEVVQQALELVVKSAARPEWSGAIVQRARQESNCLLMRFATFFATADRLVELCAITIVFRIFNVDAERRDE